MAVATQTRTRVDYTSKGFDLNQFIQDNQAFILKLSHKYSNMSGLEIDDLFQEGAMGMVRAYEKFDVSKGVKFLTYAYYWCDQYQREFCFKNTSQVHIPKSVQLTSSKEQKEEFPSTDRISKSQHVMATFKKMVRLDDEENFSEPAVDTGMDEMEHWEPISAKTKDALIQLLTKEEYFIMKLRYGLEDPYCFTLEKVGEILNCTREWVRIKEKRALDKLKFFFESEDEWIS